MRGVGVSCSTCMCDKWEAFKLKRMFSAVTFPVFLISKWQEIPFELASSITRLTEKDGFCWYLNHWDVMIPYGNLQRHVSTQPVPPTPNANIAKNIRCHIPKSDSYISHAPVLPTEQQGGGRRSKPLQQQTLVDG